MQPLTVSMIQTSTHWHDPAANREMFSNWLDQVPDGVDLVLLPEMFSTGFTMDSAAVAEPMHGETVTWLIEQAVTRDQALCGSVVIAADGDRHDQARLPLSLVVEPLTRRSPTSLPR